MRMGTCPVSPENAGDWVVLSVPGVGGKMGIMCLSYPAVFCLTWENLNWA